MSNCLVIIDVQKGFISESTNYVPERIRNLVKNGKISFDHVIATQYYNEPGSPYVRFMGWTDFMDTESQTICPELDGLYEKVIRKNIYTCFTDEFIKYIKNNDIDKLYLAGIDTDCCVLKSAVDAFEKEIDSEVLINYCASNGGEESHNAAVKVLERTIGKNNINCII